MERKSSLTKHFFFLVSCILLLLTFAPVNSMLRAEEFPGHPVRLIIPTTPGGTLDTLCRAIQPYMQKILNVQVPLENVPGASHKIGLTRIWKSKPDGYTIICNSIPQNVLGEVVIYKTDYLMRDFSYICAISKVKTVLFVHWDSWSTFDDFLSAAKQRVLVGGVSGVGSAAHLSGLVAMDELKLNPKWVNFDSGGEALAALAGKHIDFIVTLGPTAFPMVKANRVRPLIVIDEEPDPFFPTTPTAKQKGIEITPTPAYFGMLAPPNTPQDRLDILEKAFLKAVNDPGLQKLSNDRFLNISFISAKDYKQETERQFRLVEKYRNFLKADLK